MSKAATKAIVAEHLIDPISILVTAQKDAFISLSPESKSSFEDEVSVHDEALCPHELFGLAIIRGGDYELLEENYSDDLGEIEPSVSGLMTQMKIAQCHDELALQAMATLNAFNKALFDFAQAHGPGRYKVEPSNAMKAEITAEGITHLLTRLHESELLIPAV